MVIALSVACAAGSQSGSRYAVVVQSPTGGDGAKGGTGAVGGDGGGGCTGSNGAKAPNGTQGKGGNDAP